MMFLSREKSPSLLYRSGNVEYIDAPHGKFPVTKAPKWIKFQALNAPIFAPGLPSRNSAKPNEAWGQLNSERCADLLGEDAKEIEQFLLTHRDFGLEWVAVDQETGSETDFVNNQMIIAQKDAEDGSEGYYCKLCEKYLASAQAVNGHKTSNKHQERAENYLRHLKQSREQIRVK
jgi:hypothetical protein